MAAHYHSASYRQNQPDLRFVHQRHRSPPAVIYVQQPQLRDTRQMAAQQYSFPPPPPPPPGPPPSNHQQQHPQYQYAQPQPQPQYQQPQRGGGAPRGGRGGNQGARGDFHAPYNPQQPNGGYIPLQAQGPPPQQGPPSGYGGPSPSPYIGPQAPIPQNQQGPPNGFGGPGPQWQNDQHVQQHGPPHHGPTQQQQHPQQPPMQHQPHPPQPAPLSAQNYHPNYAPQAYQPQQLSMPQYGPQQPPQQFQPSPAHSYGHSVPPHQPPHVGPPQQWAGPPQQARPPFNNTRGRGGFNHGRGGHEAPLMGPPIRMGFDNDRGGGHMAQAGNGFPHQFANHQSPAPPFSQPPYQGYPPQDFGGQRPPLDPNPYNSGPHRGRGGHSSNFRGRDRGNFQQFTRGGGNHNGGRDNNNRHSSNGHRAPSNDFHKSAGADGNGKKKKKRRTTNTLGLTPNGVDHEESEDEIDDVDEEARLVTLLGPDTPQLPTDLDAWLAERRSRFPTKARRDVAAEELRQRREQGRLARLARSNEKAVKKEEGETKLEKTQRKAEKLRLELEKMERKIEQETSGSKRKRENADEGEDDNLAQSDDSEGSSESGSEPETFSSSRHIPMRVMQVPKAQLQRHCKYFSTGGTCGKKGKCRFVHDQEVRNQAMRDKDLNGGKMTLAQRLILNDTAKDDLTILKSIKYLKEKGLMSEQLTGGAPLSEDGRFKSEENNYHENLNYGD